MTRTPCYAYLNARIMPVARGKLFEIPLAKVLAERGIGQVAGGGTLCAQDGEIIHCGIDVDLELTPSNLDFVCGFLARRGAPKGSKLQFERNGPKEEVPFGQTEGIVVYLNGTDLPDEVYKTSDVNVVMETFYALTSDVCIMRGYWRGPRDTALYMYGPSAAELQSRVSRFVAEYPLCQKARVVQIA
jgi:hypothetical protein